MLNTGTIDELCDIEYGTRVVKKNEKGTEYPVFGGGGESFRIDKFNRCDRLIVARFGMSLKCTRYVSGKFFLNDSGLTLCPKNKNLSQPYLDKLILNLNNQIYSLGSGSAQKNLRMDKFRLLNISYPSLLEQQRIVAKLDTAFAEIDKSIKIKRLLLLENKKVFKSLLEDCFNENHKRMRIGDLGQVSSGGTPSSKKRDFWEGDIQWYSSGELNNKFTKKSIKRITNEGLINSNAKLFPRNSLLVGMYDNAAMKMSIIREEATFNQAIVGIAPNKFASTEYLFYTLNYLKESILQQRRGVRQQNLSLAKIKNIEVPIPDIQKQKSIVEKLNFFKQQNLLYEEYLFKIIDNLTDLKLAILSQEVKN